MSVRKIRNVCGREISKWRNNRSLSQSQLASKCQIAGWDVSRDMIARIELGIRAIEDRDMAFLANVLQVKIEEFYPPKIRARLPVKTAGRA